jgi:ankyrin repeat protein
VALIDRSCCVHSPIQAAQSIGESILPFPGEEQAFRSNASFLRNVWNDPEFPQKCYNASLEAAAKLRRKPWISCADLYNKATSVRSRMAHDTRDPQADDFGSFRQSWQWLLTSIDRAQEISDCPTLRYADQWTTLFKYLLANANTTIVKGFFTLQTTFKGVVLSTISCHIDPKKWETRTPWCGLQVQHAPPDSYSQLQEPLETIFSTLKQYIGVFNANEQDVFYHLGKLHWILAHTCPLGRGSAATTDMVLRAISKAIFPEQPLQRYKEGCTPDLVAIFCDDIETYARSYKELFSDKEIVEEPYQDVVQRVLQEQIPDYTDLGWSELEVAVSSGQNLRIKELLSKNDHLKINARYHGKTLLESAISFWHSEDRKDAHIIEVLLERGADPTSGNVEEVLEFAIFTGKKSLVKEILSATNSLGLNGTCYGKTFLEHAITAMVKSKTKDPSVVEMLLEKGADPSIVPWNSAIEMAIITGRNALAMQILSAHSTRDLTSEWHHGNQLLKFAIEALIKGRSKDAEIIKLLFSKRIDVGGLSEELHHLEEAFNSETGMACQEVFKLLSKALLITTVSTDPKLLDYILSKNRDIDINAENGMLLNQAVYHAEYMQPAAADSVLVLLNRGADWTHVAAEKMVGVALSLKKWDLAQEILSQTQAVMNFVSYREKFLLEHVLEALIGGECHDLSILKLLLEKGADPGTIPQTMRQRLKGASRGGKDPVCTQTLNLLSVQNCNFCQHSYSF